MLLNIGDLLDTADTRSITGPYYKMLVMNLVLYLHHSIETIFFYNNNRSPLLINFFNAVSLGSLYPSIFSNLLVLVAF